LSGSVALEYEVRQYIMVKALVRRKQLNSWQPGSRGLGREEDGAKVPIYSQGHIP
jgi:hypothetical protein